MQIHILTFAECCDRFPRVTHARCGKLRSGKLHITSMILLGSCVAAALALAWRGRRSSPSKFLQCQIASRILNNKVFEVTKLKTTSNAYMICAQKYSNLKRGVMGSGINEPLLLAIHIVLPRNFPSSPGALWEPNHKSNPASWAAGTSRSLLDISCHTPGILPMV